MNEFLENSIKEGPQRGKKLNGTSILFDALEIIDVIDCCNRLHKRNTFNKNVIFCSCFLTKILNRKNTTNQIKEDAYFLP